MKKALDPYVLVMAQLEGIFTSAEGKDGKDAMQVLCRCVNAHRVVVAPDA